MEVPYATSNFNQAMKKRGKGRWFIKIHRRLLKPPYPVIIYCPACGKSLIRVNADLIEIANNFGLKEEELTAQDAWSEQKHTCGAKIALYWKP